MQLVSYSGGVVVEALKKRPGSNPNNKTRRPSAGALTNLARDATLALTNLASTVAVRVPCWEALLDVRSGWRGTTATA